MASFSRYPELSAGAGDVVAASTNTFTTNQIIQGTTTASLLRITQLGTGNAILVEDNTSPDGTAFAITQVGDMQVGTTNNYGKVNIASSLAIHGANAIINFVDASNARLGYLYHDATNMILLNQTAGYVSLGTNNIERMRIDSAGNIGIGASADASITLRVIKNIAGGVNAYGITSQGVVQSGVTSSAYGYYSAPGTAAASFTLSNLYHFASIQGTFDALSTVTNQVGFSVSSGMTGATNNYGFSSNIPSGTNRWNLYMGGTANNYMAGNLGLAVAVPTVRLDVSGSTTIGTQVNVAAAFGTTTSGRLLVGSVTSNTPFVGSEGATPLLLNTNGVNRVHISSVGRVGIGGTSTATKLYVLADALGGTAGDEVTALMTHSANNNGDFVSTKYRRVSTGTDWTTAQAKIQRKIDATDMGYVAFGGTSAQNVRIGSNITDIAVFEVNGTTITTSTTTAKVLVVKGVAAQTGRLQEWQDSAGADLAYVTSAGAAKFFSIDGGTP